MKTFYTALYRVLLFPRKFYELDSNNNIIEGSPEEIQTVNDVWSFSRDLNSDDPTWNLTEIAQDVHVKE